MDRHGKAAGRQDRPAEHGCPVFPSGWQPDPRLETPTSRTASHTLSVFFPDAEEVPNAGLEDGKTWIEERIEDLIRHRYDAVLDVGGGATGFSRLVQEVPLLEAIEGSAVRVVGLFCIGPETADLDYLEQFAEVDMFMPAATVIVANGGLVLSGRSVGGAFKPILEHSAIRAAMAKGGRLAMFPALSCMSQVTDRGLTFTEAAKGQAKPGGEPLALFDRGAGQSLVDPRRARVLRQHPARVAAGCGGRCAGERGRLMDSTSPTAPHPPEGEGPKDWVAEFRRKTDEIRVAAAEWAVRWDEPEGRFISALMGAMEIVGNLSASAQAAFVQTSRDGRAAAEADLLRAKEIHQAGTTCPDANSEHRAGGEGRARGRGCPDDRPDPAAVHQAAGECPRHPRAALEQGRGPPALRNGWRCGPRNLPEWLWLGAMGGLWTAGKDR